MRQTQRGRGSGAARFAARRSPPRRSSSLVSAMRERARRLSKGPCVPVVSRCRAANGAVDLVRRPPCIRCARQRWPRAGTGSEIYAMNADGSGKVNLTNDPADEFAPSWSPDGDEDRVRALDGGRRRDLRDERRRHGPDNLTTTRRTTPTPPGRPTGRRSRSRVGTETARDLRDERGRQRTGRPDQHRGCRRVHARVVARRHEDRVRAKW